MSECKYCDEDFSSEKEKLRHELDEHEEDMSSHDKSQKKSKLNKLEQKEQTSKHNKKQKLQYGAVGLLLVGLVAGGGFFAYQNAGSVVGPAQTNASIGVGEPVHWHADYRITVCGDEKILQGGPTKAHTHGEKTFHLEGVRNSREEATLDWIVDQLGGQLEENSIMGQEGCNGEPANLTVKVNGDKIEDHMNYIPRDGDMIRIDYS